MKIGKENKFGGISKTLDITKQVVELVTADLWKSCLQDPIIINLRSCDDTSSDDDDDCDVSDALIDETVEL
ncbi:unnamed protein product [Allacma fusca]|uniref:Uncharacterized protein n=1 Tax=Allacma fusca TaxID=39272 RepID=A0A8J2P8Q3_9HEXA|nr:unnamed protein product [Allacma fusca]